MISVVAQGTTDPRLLASSSSPEFPPRNYLYVISQIFFASVGLIRKICFCGRRMRLLKPSDQTTKPNKCPSGANHKTAIILMKRTLLFLLAFTSFAIVLQASPTPTPSPKRTSNKNEKKNRGQTPSPDEIARSANGWSYAKGEWVHPDGYKYVRGQILRTTAKIGKPAPEPPGKLAQQNPTKLRPQVPSAPANAQTAAEKAAEARRKNLTPIAAPQTGSHL
jgi:hypothetical protein